MTFGEKIAEKRKLKGWSQEQFSDILGVSRQAVSKWETGEAYPDTEKIIKISVLFDVSTDYLLKDYCDSEEATPGVMAVRKTEIHTAKIIGGFLCSLFGVIILGVINVFAEIDDQNVSHGIGGYYTPPFISFIHNFGLEWLVVIGALMIIGGVIYSLVCFIKKRQTVSSKTKTVKPERQARRK